MSRNFSINVGDVITACALVVLAYRQSYLPIIAILLCLVLAELARIRKAIDSIKKGSPE